MAVTSTVLDAALCLLLVSASVVTVATTATDRPTVGDGVDAAAATLATSTTTVNYTLAPGARNASGTRVDFPETDGPAFRRTAHGTLVALLADAAMGRVAVAGGRLTHARDDLAAGVRRAVQAAVGTARTQVVAVWRPYPGAPVGGRVVVGDGPPPGTDVHAARVSVDSPSPGGRARIAAAGDRGYGPLAHAVARRTTAALFPRRAMELALGGDYPVSALVRHRYRRAASLTGASLDGALERGRVTAANRALTRALARRFERDLRREFASPAAAARAVRVDEVRIVVRGWSA
ncbi:MAG: hypothetical protein ABEJ61_06525 [Haloferacaceae archaeon]